ncbi:3-dehydroquinate synthase II [Clostridium sp. SHJSY1]|uniref:3-dehydroquinate synthase II n=1 Tax=Clostridium sp. SHJSY1 TaxID=2942483 RepID=UPI002876492E|nr:3-dehydroquinate synthase II [Clostridium sp. SHJSY1]MDS0527100.1 3-dehydroquinate synthase II [Clostridium sp. SHJSY1]
MKKLWYDARKLTEDKIKVLIPLALNNGFTGIMMNFSQRKIRETLPQNVLALIFISSKEKKEAVEYLNQNKSTQNIIFFSESNELLEEKMFEKIKKGIWVEVKDKSSMNEAISLSNNYESCIIDFKSDTNIPLELVLAFSQKNKCEICKKVTNPEDGWIATMTMEMGSYAVLLDSEEPENIIGLKLCMEKYENNELKMKKLKITFIKHIGMGDRVCIDTTSNLHSDEGMIIGSTSYGGILVSSETHFLPYMELRPFRVNAGALHSYIFCKDNTTKYLSELKAGDEVLAVNAKGETRIVSVGRVKIERRPLLLINAVSDNGVCVNTIVQDDWHIRILGENGEVKNSTLLKEGEFVLGYISEPGRHLGVKISETIIEK